MPIGIFAKFARRYEGEKSVLIVDLLFSQLEIPILCWLFDKEMLQKPASATPVVDIVKNSREDAPIDVAEVNRILLGGLDDHSDERCFAWLIAIGLFPPYEALWKSKMEELYKAYKDFVELVELQTWETRVFPAHFPCDDFGVEDNSIMAVIHGDVVRTGRMLSFLPPRPIKGAEDDGDILARQMENVRRIERMLYVFAKLNRTTGYMQGFNELITPLYYVCVKSLDSIFGGDIDACEGVVFHMFQELMTKTRILEFYTTQDKSSIILNRVKKFEADMQRHVPRVHEHIKALHIHPLFYSLRWFTLLFAQEHELPSLLLIWDSLFAHFDVLIDYVACVAMAHMKFMEDKIATADYGATISALQNMCIEGNVVRVIVIANQFWDEDQAPPKKSFFAKLFGK